MTACQLQISQVQKVWMKSQFWPKCNNFKSVKPNIWVEFQGCLFKSKPWWSDRSWTCDLIGQGSDVKVKMIGPNQFFTLRVLCWCRFRLWGWEWSSVPLTLAQTRKEEIFLFFFFLTKIKCFSFPPSTFVLLLLGNLFFFFFSRSSAAPLSLLQEEGWAAWDGPRTPSDVNL